MHSVQIMNDTCNEPPYVPAKTVCNMAKVDGRGVLNMGAPLVKNIEI